MTVIETNDYGCTIEFEGETIKYSNEEIEDMKKDYIEAIERVLSK